MTGFDPADTGWYHGGDLKGLTGGCTDPVHGLQRIKDLGFTAIWVTPVVGQQAVQGRAPPTTATGAVDFTDVDKHLGSARGLQGLHRLRPPARAEGDPRRGRQPHRGRDPRRLRLRRAGRAAVPRLPRQGLRRRRATRAGARSRACRARNMPRQPTLIGADRTAKKPAWLNDVTAYHDRGDIDFSSCSATCFEQGDFFGLDDLFTEQPRVVNGLAQVYGGLDPPLRDRRLPHRHGEARRPRLLRRVAAEDPRRRARSRDRGLRGLRRGRSRQTRSSSRGYVRDRGLPNVIDFPLQDSLDRFARRLRRRARRRDAALGRRLLPRPLGDLADARDVPRQSRHGPGRTHDREPGLRRHRRSAAAAGPARLQPALPPPRRARRHVRGRGRDDGSGGDKAARQDMFPTQVRDWQVEKRVGSPPIGKGSSFDVTGQSGR